MYYLVIKYTNLTPTYILYKDHEDGISRRTLSSENIKSTLCTQISIKSYLPSEDKNITILPFETKPTYKIIQKQYPELLL